MRRAELILVFLLFLGVAGSSPAVGADALPEAASRCTWPSETPLCWPYDFPAQIMAQAICTALNPVAGPVFAVPRRCPVLNPDRVTENLTCDEICSRVAYAKKTPAVADKERLGPYGKKWGHQKCFNAVHIYGYDFTSPAEKLNEPGLATYSYNPSDCSHPACGPNYCCCGRVGNRDPAAQSE